MIVGTNAAAIQVEMGINGKMTKDVTSFKYIGIPYTCLTEVEGPPGDVNVRVSDGKRRLL